LGFWTVDNTGSLTGGLYELGFTAGLAVENVVEGMGLVECDIVVVYDDDTEPGVLLLANVTVGLAVPVVTVDGACSVYWFLDVDVDVVDDVDDDETANWAVGL
jgi:hypothetical protein